MVTLTKPELELFSQYVDNINPKYEFECVIADDGYLWATNTRALIRQPIDEKEKFSVHCSVIEASLKVKGAVSFELEDKQITCFDKKETAIVTISKNHKFEKFPKLRSIFPKTFKSQIRYNHLSQINGIFAVNGVHVDSRYIPKKLPCCSIGTIQINDAETPVNISITSEFSSIDILIMPIIDNYLVPQE